MSQKYLILIALVLLLVISATGSAKAQEKPIQGALFAPIQIFDENYKIAGVRLSLLYGKNASVSGLDFGLVNHTTSGRSMGVSFGLVGYNQADFVGWQGNMVNITQGSFEGLQWGVFNQANHASGLQLGLVNSCVTLNGIQIGLVNMIKQGGQFPIFPIVNWSIK